MEEQHAPNQEQSNLQRSVSNQNVHHFGNYDLIRRIDVGGMGEVYLARQRTAFGREVAIKIMRSDLVHDPIARKRFLREAEVIAHLLHEHILTLIEFSEEDGRLFLVTPYIKGGTLARRLHRGPLSLGEVYRLFKALVQAIAYIHKRGVVHRDLKPANILLDSEEGSNEVYVRLIDFGIASVASEQAGPPLTLTGHELGTAAYMAPERLNGVSAPSNDIYSLGVILHEMVTGQLPSVSGKVVALAQPLSAIVRCCMAINPEERFGSAEELLSAFEQAYEVMQNSSPQLQYARPTLPPLEKGSSSGRMAAVKASQPASLNEVLVHRGEFVLSPLPGKGEAFRREDYEAPTSYVAPADLARAQVNLADAAAVAAPPSKPPPAQRKKRKRSFFGVLTVSIIAVLFIIAGMSYMIFQNSISATIVVTPRVQTISHVFTLSAKPALQAVDMPSSSVPAYTLTSNKTVTASGPTSGKSVGCLLGLTSCQQIVDAIDIYNLISQLRPALHTAIMQDLQNQAHKNQCIIVGSNAVYANESYSENPPIGTTSSTVTASLSEQGTIECVKTHDVDALAMTLFQQQVPQNYVLLDQLTRIGQPVVKSAGQDGVVKLAVAMAGVARYQIPDQELSMIRGHVNGMKPQAAQAYIATLPGVNADAISIHLSYGETIPTNVQQIHVSTANPMNLPSAQLPKA